MTALLPVLLLAALPAAAQEASSGPVALELTVDSAVELALRNNLDVELADLRLAELRSYHRQAVAAAVPDVTLTGSYTRNFKKAAFFFGGNKMVVGSDNSMRHAATVEQVVYSGGIVSSGIRATRAGIGVGREDAAGARADVVLAVRRFFYAVFLASETVRIQEDNLSSSEDHLRTISERYRQGLDSDLTLLRQRVEVAGAKPALIQARNAYELTAVLLKDTLGIDVDAPVRFLGSLEPPPPALPVYEEVLKRALDANPDLRAARQRALKAEAMLDVARGGRKPQVSLYADYQWFSESDFAWPKPLQRGTSSAGGVRVRWPIFTGGDITEKIRQASAESDMARTSALKIERAVRVEVKRRWLSVQEAAERAASQESAIGQARRALDATEVRYRAGESSQLELTDATLALQRARLLYAQALHDYRAELASLERAAGSSAEETVR